MLKRLLILLLMFSIIITVLACSKNDGTPKTNPTNISGAEDGEEDSYSARRNAKDDLPERDFEGYDFTVYLRVETGTNQDFVAETETGDIINDAVFARNMAVSERFNVNIKFNFDTTQNTTYTTTAVNAILADEDVNDVLGLHGAFAFVYAKQSYVVDWKTDLLYINLDKPWWDHDFAENLAIANRLFAMTGDISHLSIGATFCMVFNKNLFDKYVLEYPYKSVIDGTWTFDKFAQIVKDSSIDLNGDGQQTPGEDLYGFTTGSWGAPIQAFYMAGDRIITLDSDGVPSLTVYNERTINIFEKFFDLADNYNFYIDGYSPAYTGGSMFRNDLCMIAHASMGSLVSLRDMESDIGIIPFPKFNEIVDKYPSLVDAGQNIFSVPVTARDLDRTSIILEAFAAEGYRNVVPTFYEQALQVKYARDDDSAAMLDIIRDNRIFDYGYFDATISWDLSYTGFRLVNHPSHDFASFYAAYEKQAETNLANLYEQYLEVN
ncbi:MAG: hypothetical protein FWF15_05940 [Oscillospiraceae bacterium]|nr:hypothetical protein [Oscillospiraceae bacterium]